MTDESRRGDGETTEHLIEVDLREESVSEKLVTMIATLENVPPVDLPILYDVVDVDALNAYFNTRSDGAGSSSDHVVYFTYTGYKVRIHSVGTITLSALE